MTSKFQIPDEVVEKVNSIVDIIRLTRQSALEEAADAVGKVGDHADAGAYIAAIRALGGDK